MKPSNIYSQIFLDSADPVETQEMIDKLGWLDGQTTNPSLVTKTPAAMDRFAAGEKFSRDELFAYYKTTVQQISALLPEGSVSVEVYADATTSLDEILNQAHAMNAWIPNAHIKLPIIPNGLLAAQQLVKEKINVNMTLCFSQAQAAAVYAATIGAEPGMVYVSPFEGRLDDIGYDGMDLITNVQRMFNEQGDGHVATLMASVRDVKHLLAGINAQIDIITVPTKVLRQWHEEGMPLPGKDIPVTEIAHQTDIEFKQLDLNQTWESFNIVHPLTEKGLQRFADDWNKLIQ